MNSISVKIVDRIGSSWDEWFGVLMKFKSREGHCDVPQNHYDGVGTWVTHQRQFKNTMSNERRQRLDAIGFIWDARESRWEEQFAALERVKASEGHCAVPRGQLFEGTNDLAKWVTKQRSKKDTMSAERRQRLDAIGFIWDVVESWWEEGFAAFKKFKAQEGHCRVPALHRDREGFQLGGWVHTQRQTRNTMSDEHRQRLDDIGFIWDPFEVMWEEGFAALKQFNAREGHCRVPYKHCEGTFNLGSWVGRQRMAKDTMSAERKRRLDAIGFVWDPLKKRGKMVA